MFSSGSSLCEWIVLGTRLQQAGPPKQIWTLLPRTHWQILDTWHAAGLKGSASNDLRVKGAFVPREFSSRSASLRARAQIQAVLINQKLIGALPLAGFFYFNVTTEALGIARGAIDARKRWTDLQGPLEPTGWTTIIPCIAPRAKSPLPITSSTTGNTRR